MPLKIQRSSGRDARSGKLVKRNGIPFEGPSIWTAKRVFFFFLRNFASDVLRREPIFR